VSLVIKFILIITISINCFGFETIYFLPKDSKKAKKDITKLLKNSKKSIDIAIYNFTYKKFNKAIDKAIQNGIDVTIIYQKTKLKFNKKIDLIKTKRKLHIKLAIIDQKYIIFGTANWTKDSFGKNYEIVTISDDKDKVKQMIKIIERIKKEN